MSHGITTPDQAMLSALLGVKKARTVSNGGICLNVDEELYAMSGKSADKMEKILLDDTFWQSGTLLNQAFKSWPKFSGSCHFPVPSSKKGQGASEAYESHNRWSRRTKYGKLRWELLDHCIEYFQQQVNQANQIQGDSHASS